MKKISMIAVTAVAALSLTGSGLAPLSQSAATTPVFAAKKASQYSDAQYAVMAYLKVDNQTPQDLANEASAITWEHHGNTYRVSLNDKTTKIRVGKTNVKVTYHKLASDGSVAKTGHKTYSKAQLAKQYKGEMSDLKNIVSSAKAANSSSNASSSSKQSGANSSSAASSNSASSLSASSTSQSSTSSTKQSKLTIAGHTFHRQNFYGNEIWVGDNNEGELGDWFANEPSLNNNQNLQNQVNQANNGGN